MAAPTDDGAPVPISIVIADDHAMVRSGLRMLLEAAPDINVVGEASDVGGALRGARSLRPRVLLLDLNMPGRSSLSAIPDLLASAPGTAIVVMTMQEDPAYARHALAAGASGYVRKEAADTELLEAVRAAAAGRTYVDSALGALPAGDEDAADAGTAAAGELAKGSVFAGHRIESLVGRGGQGVVYLATDLALDRRVALKLIAPGLAGDPVFRARFERECRLTAALDHPHVVQVFHAGQVGGALYLTMRYVEGTDLRSVLGADGRLEPSRAVSLIAQVADGLAEAHRHGLVHRDVKPGNILLGRGRGGEVAFLTDFGVTKQRVADADLTAPGFAVGTADYMAPEQARGGIVDARADIYALGCVLFRTLTGAVLYERDSDVEKLWAHIHEPPPALLSVCPELPPDLGTVLDRALAKLPEERQQSASELGRQALAALA